MLDQNLTKVKIHQFSSILLSPLDMGPKIPKGSQAASSGLKSVQEPSGSTEISSALKLLGRRGVFGDDAGEL